MHIALIEPNLSGHHRFYLLTFSRILEELGHDVSIISTDSKYSFQGKILKYTNPSLFFKKGVLKKINVCFNLLVTILNLWRVRIVINKKVDGAFFCCFDDYMNELMPAFLFDIVFPIKTSGLLLKAQSFRYLGILDRRNILSARKCRSIGCLDEFSINELRSFNTNVFSFPDFSDDANPNMEYHLVIQILKNARKRKVISILGAIEMRKGIRNFVESAKRMSDREYYFVIAGKSFLSIEEEEYVRKNFTGENKLFYPEQIPSEADFNGIIQISDVIYAAYVNFTQSSNMLAKSAIFGKPLIVSKGHYMEKIVRKYHLGYVIDQNSVEEAMSSIKMAVYNWANEDYAKNYLMNNSMEQLYDSFELVVKSLE